MIASIQLLLHDLLEGVARVGGAATPLAYELECVLTLLAVRYLKHILLSFTCPIKCSVIQILAKLMAFELLGSI